MKMQIYAETDNHLPYIHRFVFRIADRFEAPAMAVVILLGAAMRFTQQPIWAVSNETMLEGGHTAQYWGS